MKYRLITNLQPHPAGFELVELSRKQLMGGPVALLCSHIDPIVSEFQPYLERISGCFINAADELKVTSLSQRLWHIQIPETYLPELSLLLLPLLVTLEHSMEIEDHHLILQRHLERSERSLKSKSDDYQRVNNDLQGKVNDLVAAQQEIVQLNQVLESRVKERTADLEQSLERVHQTQEQLIQAEKLAALGSMVAGVAHEINTPLGNCVLAASSLKDTVEEVLESVSSGVINKQQFMHNMEQLKTGFELLNTNLNRGADLVGRFKQVAADQSFEERRKFQMAELIEDTLAAMSPRLKRGRCEVEWRCDEDVELDSYPGDFSQILMNLVVNSLIHGFHERPGGRINILVTACSNHMQLEYSDSGDGLSEEACQRLFEPFYTTNRERGGTGLGMAIIHNLISQRLGGSIRLASGIGEGVRFVIRTQLNAP
ncbi:MAG: ATP-binding protein [Motiliproteus sp.]